MAGDTGRAGLVDRLVPALVGLTVVAAIAATLLPAWRYGRSPDVLDAATGLVLGGCALVVRGRARAGTAALVAGAGLTWYLPAVVPTGSVALDRILASLSLVHVGLLGLAVLVATGWTVRSRVNPVQTAAAAAAVMVAVSGVVGGYTLALPLAGAAILVATRSAPPLVRVAAVVLGAELLLAAVVRLLASGSVEAQLFRLHALAVMTVGVLLAVDSVQRLPRQAATPEERSVRLTHELTRAAGVAALDLRVRDAQGWLDLDGEPAPAPRPDDGWRLLDAPTDVAVRPSDVSIPKGGDLAEVFELAADQARLRAAVRRSAADLAGMQGRLVSAGDDERAELGERLRRGPLARVDRIHAQLTGRADDAALAAVARRTAADLQAVAAGLDPVRHGESTLQAVTRLAAGAPLAVQVTARSTDDPLAGASDEDALRRSAWFVCAEAITNAAKHAPGARVTIAVGGALSADERVVVTVADDGPGGADPSGHGLVGLRDRAEAVGARLRIRSPRGVGTTLELLAPLPAPSGGVGACSAVRGGPVPMGAVGSAPVLEAVTADG